MNRFRGAAFLLAAGLLLPACHSDPDGDRLRVTNVGAEDILVSIDWYEYEDGCGCDTDHHVYSYVLPPGSSVSTEHGWVESLFVLITRVSDDSLVFSASFDDGDFYGDPGSVDLTVNP